MSVTRWNPWGELFNLTESLDQILGRTMMQERGSSAAAYLPLDIRQTENAFVIEASLPGFKPEQVEVTLDENVLTISAHFDEETEQSKGGYVRRERRANSLFRQVGLPAEVRAEGISAGFENGILTITVPRAQKAQPRRIEVGGSHPSIVEHKAEQPSESAS